MTYPQPISLIVPTSDFFLFTDGSIVGHLFNNGEKSLLALSIKPGKFTWEYSDTAEIKVTAGMITLFDKTSKSVFKEGDVGKLNMRQEMVVTTFTQVQVSLKSDHNSIPYLYVPVGPRPRFDELISCFATGYPSFPPKAFDPSNPSLERIDLGDLRQRV